MGINAAVSGFALPLLSVGSIEARRGVLFLRKYPYIKEEVNEYAGSSEI